ncbi:CRISPR-associated helicase Cas3' [Sulfolobus tengchongensis]|uniref:CRISPR-associated helicase Cas3 n=1 Tax=Sulfolobus tengchongensis TaxID=207809 RepID=A0AAX4L367_9CREN
MRQALTELLSSIEKYGPESIYLADLPTGYGKTKNAPLVYKEFYDMNWVSNGIHILPLRSLVSSILDDFVQKDREILKKAGLTENDLAYQMGDFLENYKKEPLFDASYVLTTMDSYAHNLFKIPVTEIFRYQKHYFIPLGRIFISLIVFDEAHIFFESEDSAIPSIFLEAINAHHYMKNPVLILSATLSDFYVREIAKNRKLVRVKLSLENKIEEKNGYTEIHIRDKEFEDLMKSVKLTVEKIKLADVKQRAQELASSGLKILIVIDDIKKASLLYQSLKDSFNVGLIHSRLTREDRSNVIKRLDNLDILIGTSAIEAGIDRSFDALITTVININSLIQRIGRVCRYGCKESSGKIYLIEDFKGSDNNVINSIVGKDICWRLPYTVSCETNYYELINKFSISKIKLNNEYRDSLKRVLSPFYTSQRLLEKFLEDNKYSLTRSLVEFYTLGEDFLTVKDMKDIISNSFVMELELVEKNWNNIKDYIMGIGYFEFKNNTPRLADEKKVDNVSDFYIRFIENYGTPPIFILKKDSYIRGVGVLW